MEFFLFVKFQKTFKSVLYYKNLKTLLIQSKYNSLLYKNLILEVLKGKKVTWKPRGISGISILTINLSTYLLIPLNRIHLFWQIMYPYSIGKLPMDYYISVSSNRRCKVCIQLSSQSKVLKGILIILVSHYILSLIHAPCSHYLYHFIKIHIIFLLY